MICLIALDFVLRIISARVMCVALVAYVFGMNPYDPPADTAGFRIPTYVISNFEYPCHGGFRGQTASDLAPFGFGRPYLPVRNIDCRAIAARRLRYLETVICAVMLG
jgi:hypothetical protein